MKATITRKHILGGVKPNYIGDAEVNGRCYAFQTVRNIHTPSILGVDVFLPANRYGDKRRVFAPRIGEAIQAALLEQEGCAD